MKVVLFNSLTKKGILMTLKSTRDMIEKVLITDTNVINAITRQLNIKNIRNEMFPTWRLTLQPGEEYDLKTSYYGMYMVRWADAGATALIMIGAGVSANILLNNGASISTDFTEVGKIILNKKAVNGTVFVKNNGNKETGINVMQITNYYQGLFPCLPYSFSI